MFLYNGLNWQQAILTSLDEWPVNLNREHILKSGKNMLALPKSQKVYENPNFTEILLLSSWDIVNSRVGQYVEEIASIMTKKQM